MPPGTRLYLLTPPRFEPAAFARVLEDALAGGDVAALQIRLKPARAQLEAHPMNRVTAESVTVDSGAPE